MHSAKETARKDTLINTHIIIIKRNLGHMRKRNRVLWKVNGINKAVLWQRPLCSAHTVLRDLLSSGGPALPANPLCWDSGAPAHTLLLLGLLLSRSPDRPCPPLSHWVPDCPQLWGGERPAWALCGWITYACHVSQEDKCGAGRLSQERASHGNNQKTQEWSTQTHM